MSDDRALPVPYVPPGWAAKVAPRLLSALRDGGIPFLRGADDAALRTMALNLLSAGRRLRAGSIADEQKPFAVDDGFFAPIAFARLAADDEPTLLPDNRAAFEAKCALVAEATSSIDVALYYLADDATGERFAALLEAAAQRGVRVRLAVDAHATEEKQFGPFGYESTPARGALVLLDRLREVGCEIHVLGGDRWAMHRKFLFVDRATLVLGGRNVADHYATPGWRDLELVFRGPFAMSFGAVVDRTFADILSLPRARTDGVPGILEGVPRRTDGAFARAVSSLVEHARKTVDVEHAYLLSHPWLEEALVSAIVRGVRVRVFTNSGASNDLAFMNWRLATSTRALVEAGAHVYRRTAPGATLHTKLVVGDRCRVVFGSSNLDYYSPVYCAELDVAIESEELGARLTTIIDAGLAEPTTREVRAGSPEAVALERECSPWSVSRVCDLVFHDLQ